MSEVTIYASSPHGGLGFFHVKSDNIKFESWPRDASLFKVVRIDSKLGKKYGYNESDKLAVIILVSKTGLDIDNLVARVDTSDSKNWRITFEKPLKDYMNASYFRLTRKEPENPRTGYFWHRNESSGGDHRAGEERVLRFQGTLCKQLTFSEKVNDPVILHIKKPSEGSGFFTNENEFF